MPISLSCLADPECLQLATGRVGSQRLSRIKGQRWNHGRTSSSISSSKTGCFLSPFRTSVLSPRSKSTLPSNLLSAALAGRRPFRSCRCFATSNSLRLPVPFAHYSIPAPPTSPVRSPSQITATISYCDRSGQKFCCTILHDLAIYRDIAFVPKPERNSSAYGRFS